MHSWCLQFYYHMGYAIPLTLLICKIPLQHWESWLPPSAAIHLFNYSIEGYLYISIIIVKPYSHVKQHWLQHTAYRQFLLTFRLHLFPKILRLAPPSMRLFHTFLIRLDTLVTICILSWQPQNPKWFFYLYKLRSTLYVANLCRFWQMHSGMYLSVYRMVSLP